ncbi:MAG: hypothetical protein KKB50_00055 [Planctomycetes bacterium]|nr:hypothetical protein [Planctomycetota bacterium]
MAKTMLKLLANLDRRWIYVLMAAAVTVPVVLRLRFPEATSPLVQRVFDRLEELPAGAHILMACDYNPSTAAELHPMTTAWTWHCARKNHKLYFISLWPLGPQMIQDTIDRVLATDFPQYRYGVDYVTLGYKPGFEGVIKVIGSNLPELYTTDQHGTSLAELPLTQGLTDIRQMNLILSCSGGYPGAKEWVQYAATPLGIPLAAGSTGVHVPLLYPYVPKQMIGLLGTIKGAAEYEAALARRYPEYAVKDGLPRPAFTKAMQRMGPQLVAHCLILLLIVLGNVVVVLQRRGNVRMR